MNIAKPWSSQLELVWGCNKRCWFCGIHDIPKDTYQYMPLKIVRAYTAELRQWRPKIRVEFGTGGEPTLHPRFFEIVGILRGGNEKGQVMVQTNCEPWVDNARKWIQEFFDSAGGNILVLNCYKPGLKARFEEILPTLRYPWVDFYLNNPERLSMYHYALPRRKQQIFLCEDLGLMTLQGTTSKTPQRWLNNQGGSTPVFAYKRAGIAPADLPLEKKCTRVFRELVLSWDGRVPLCCYDWLDRKVVGRFPEQSLEEIWEGRGFQIARELLYRKVRAFTPCSTCDYAGGFRIGFLKDPGLRGTTQQLIREFAQFDSVPPSYDAGFAPPSLAE